MLRAVSTQQKLLTRCSRSTACHEDVELRPLTAPPGLRTSNSQKRYTAVSRKQGQSHIGQGSVS